MIVTISLFASTILLIGVLFGYFVPGKANLNNIDTFLTGIGGWIFVIAMLFLFYKFATGFFFIDDLMMLIAGIGLWISIIISTVLFMAGVWLGDLFEKKK